MSYYMVVYIYIVKDVVKSIYMPILKIFNARFLVPMNPHVEMVIRGLRIRSAFKTHQNASISLGEVPSGAKTLGELQITLRLDVVLLSEVYLSGGTEAPWAYADSSMAAMLERSRRLSPLHSS